MEQYFKFIQESPTAFHAADAVARRLRENGFEEISEFRSWELVPGGKYYVTRNNSSVIAFSLPEDGFGHFQIVASHSDSPTFKLKPHAEEVSANAYVRLNVERYGGMIMSTWFDRPLSIAGRAIVKTENGLESRLVNLDRDTVVIPSMPIHFNREVNDGYKYNPQVDLLPLYGSAAETGLLNRAVEAEAGGEVVASDLFLYNRTPGSVWGASGQFFSSSRIDDLECAYTSLQAFCSVSAQGHINVYAMFDNEEVGSSTKQGANSSFLQDTLNRICSTLRMTDPETRAAIASSFMVSADNAHAVHPNHPEKYDADNRTFMNQGIVIKHNANQKYTTDAVSSAIFSQVCAKASVPVQHFTNRSDILGGSTLGNIANTHTSMNTVDIGLAQLAMHSAYETAGVKDVDYMIRGLAAFYRSNITVLADGKFKID